MRYNGSPLALVVLGLIALAGTGPAQDNKDDTVIQASDGKGTTTLPVGRTLVVKLVGQAGTGYAWKLEKLDERLLSPLGKPFVEKAARVGGQNLTVFRFKAVAAGRTTMELHYRRPFAKDAPPAKTFTNQITIVGESQR